VPAGKTVQVVLRQRSSDIVVNAQPAASAAPTAGYTNQHVQAATGSFQIGFAKPNAMLSHQV
jgi:hypothetical protein